jgi:large subunit ribosomal protein L15
MPAKPDEEDAAKEEAAEDRDTPKAAGRARSTGKPAAEAAAEAPSGRGLKLHHLRPAPGARTAKTRVGRGEASKGKTAGRGTKGTKARNTMRLGFEGGQMPLYRRVPKLKGFSNAGFGTTYQVVNTGRLAELYPSGGDVTPDDLVAKGAIRKGERVKVLADGDISVALRVSAHAFSTSARERITGAGGSVTEL